MLGQAVSDGIASDGVIAAANQAAILDSMPGHIALLDREGVIISLNEAWRGFATEIGWRVAAAVGGFDDLDDGASASGPDAANVHQISEGIRAVLARSAASFSIEYPCHTPVGQRWFTLSVVRSARIRPVARR